MSRRNLLWWSGTLTVLLFFAMAIHAAPLRPSIPAIQFTYSEAAFTAILEQWQPEGVLRFKTHFAIDFPLLVSYGLFGHLLATRLPLSSSVHAAARSAWPWGLPAAAISDAAENLLHLYLVHAGGNAPAALFLLAGLVATCKWLLIAGFAAGLVLALASVRENA